LISPHAILQDLLISFNLCITITSSFTKCFSQKNKEVQNLLLSVVLLPTILNLTQLYVIIKPSILLTRENITRWITLLIFSFVFLAYTFSIYSFQHDTKLYFLYAQTLLQARLCIDGKKLSFLLIPSLIPFSLISINQIIVIIMVKAISIINGNANTLIFSFIFKRK
jgi:hypothetical protein